MRAADLKRAVELAGARDVDARLRKRLVDREPLTVILGEGSSQSTIVLAPISLGGSGSAHGGDGKAASGAGRRAMTASVASRADKPQSQSLDRKALEVTDALTPVIRNMVREEAAKIAARPPDVRVRMDRVEADIMKACFAVAEAADQLHQAQYGGRVEIPARRKLEQAANRLLLVMKKHGRV